MPNIRINLSTLSDLEELEPEDMDAMVWAGQRQGGADAKANTDLRALSAERQARRKEDRRKTVHRGGRRDQ
jgi:hypothetical protein